MTIVCGTDLSESALRGAHAAAAFAQGLRLPLKLVHVLDELGAMLTVREQGDAAYPEKRAKLHAQAEQLRDRFEVDVEAIALPGRADIVIAELASKLEAALVVVTAIGRTQRHRWLLGSEAERIVRHTHVPVLVVRDDAPFLAWARGQRALDVVVGVEPSASSKVALQWAAGLRRAGACDLRIVQLASPADEVERLGVSAGEPRIHGLPPEVERVLRRDLQAWAGPLPGPGETRIEVYGRQERVDWQLSHLAEAADLVVVGNHQRAGLDRFWNGSVSRGILKHASVNVACVPPVDLAKTLVGVTPIQRVLVSTDLSPLANRAIPVAYGLVANGGIVHLLHVVRRGSANGAALRQQLRALVPAGLAPNVETEVEVIEGDDPATVISQAAGRLGVDLVCMATRGRSGLTEALTGSQAHRVVETVRQPVVLVPPERTT